MGVKVTVSSDFGLDVRNVDFSSVYYASSYSYSATNFSAFYSNGAVDEFRGSGFTYDNVGPTGGTVKSYASFVDGERAFILDGANVPVKDILRVAETFSNTDDLVLLANNLGGNDKVTGGNGKEYIRLYGGNDVFDGKGGNDTVWGGSGNDKITGGLGADKLYGESGSDTFVYKSIKDSTVASSGRDTISDLTAGDRISLTAIDANANTAKNDAFSFIGTKGFSGKAGELRFEKHASDTYIYADVDGDKKADFAIHLDDAIVLNKGFFLL